MKTIISVLDEVREVCTNIDSTQYVDLVELFKKERRIFFMGEGRSGLVAKAIAMRLMHAGKLVFVMGETITPAIQKNDILVVLSGSAKTRTIIAFSESASKIGASVFLITTNRKALESRWCSGGLLLRAATKYRLPEEPPTIQPLGNQFDQAAHLVLDAAVIDSLVHRQTNEELRIRHVNLE